MTEPRVVIVDDHQLFRAGVRSGLEELVEIAGDAATVADAVELIRSSEPDVVLLDVHMPDGGGVEVIRRVAPEQPDVRFLALSVSDAAEDVIAVIRAGARGYVTKTISGEDLADAVRRVHGGDAVFSPRLAGFVLDAFAGTPQRAPAAGGADPELDQLTPREREVLQHIARGYMYKEIAHTLSISAKTVEARVLGAAKAPALEPPRAVALGGRAPAARSLTHAAARSLTHAGAGGRAPPARLVSERAPGGGASEYARRAGALARWGWAPRRAPCPSTS